ESCYQRDLPNQNKQDQEKYSRAVFECNQLEAAENANLYQILITEYIDGTINLEKALVELGTTEECLKKSANTLNLNTLNHILIGKTVKRDSFDDIHYKIAKQCYLYHQIQKEREKELRINQVQGK